MTNFVSAWRLSLSAGTFMLRKQWSRCFVPQALSYLVDTDLPFCPRTAAIAERNKLTYERGLLTTRGFFRDDTFGGLIRLIDLKHNWARSGGADWFNLATADL